MKKYIITISYGDCSKGTGGTDKVILSQIKLFNDAGYDVISLSPYKESGSDKYWIVLYNGIYKGVFSNSRLYSLLCDGKIYAVVIHHLLHVNVSLLDALLSEIEVPIFFYIHDYYTICPDRGMADESGRFCGHGFPCDEKCKECIFYERARKLLKVYRRFFKKYQDKITYIAPSDTAKDIWCSHYKAYADKVKVIYHQELVGGYMDNNNPIGDDEVLRVAFVGAQATHKGWEDFKAATLIAQTQKSNIMFYQFGSGEDKLDNVKQILVDFKKNSNAMMETLRTHKIHVAVLWSLVPETYSFTYYETLAANCFVITSTISGNISRQVEQRGNGVLCKELKEILINEAALKKMVNDYRVKSVMVPKELRDNGTIIEMIPQYGKNIDNKGKRCDLSSFITVSIPVKRKIKQIAKRIIRGGRA